MQFKVLLIMSEKDYLQDISDIKNIMNKSTKFISLSGLSGVCAGFYALIGAYFARNILLKHNIYDTSRNTINPNNIEIKLVGIALLVAIISIITGLIFSRNKAKQHGVKIWDATTKRLLFNFMIPLITGGVFSLILLNNGFFGYIASATLIFYGLSLFSASKYTIGNVKYLGIAEIILGLIAMNYVGYGVYFWAIGFGIFHIIYGAMMYFMLERNKN